MSSEDARYSSLAMDSSLGFGINSTTSPCRKARDVLATPKQGEVKNHEVHQVNPCKIRSIRILRVLFSQEFL
jgi:hypothetical protein